MLRTYFQNSILLLLGLSLVACSEEQPKHPDIYQVTEVFKTGPNTVVRALAVDSKSNHLWVGTSKGVNKVDYVNGNLVASYNRENGLANEYVFAINVDNKQRVWFGTNAGGISILDQGKFKTYFPMHGLADYWVYSFTQQADGKMWVGTWAGVNRIDPETEIFETYVKELVNEWVYGMDIDASGNVWFGTEGGVSRFDGKNWSSWTHDDGLGASNDGNLPVSSNTGLGTRSRHDLGIMAGGQPTYNPNYVFSLVVDKRDQSIWVGTWGGGVSRYDGKKWHSYTQGDGLAGNIVYAVLQAADGSLWFGTNGGISHFDGSNWQTINVRQQDVSSDVYVLVETQDKSIWAGSRGAVSKLMVVGSNNQTNGNGNAK